MEDILLATRLQVRISIICVFFGFLAKMSGLSDRAETDATSAPLLEKIQHKD